MKNALHFVPSASVRSPSREAGIYGRGLGMALPSGFLILIILMIAVGYRGLSTMQNLRSQSERISNEEWADVQLATEALTYADRNSWIIMQMVASRDESEINSLLATRIQNSAKISDLLKRLQTRIGSPEEQRSFDAILTSGASYIKSCDRAADILLRQRDNESAQAVVVQVSSPLLLKYQSAWKDFIRFQTEEMNQRLAASAAQYSAARKQTIWQLLLSVLLALLITAIVMGRIILEINRRRNAEGTIQDLAVDLEERVDQRTAALARANQDLGAEIAERKRVEENLRSKTAFLEAQTNSTLDGILVVDNNNRRVLQNRRFSELFKLPAELVASDDDAAALEYVVQTFKDPDGFLTKVKYLYDHQEEVSRDEIEFKNGEVFDRYSSPVVGADGRYYGRIWIFRDVTERIKRDEEVRRLSMAVEQSPVSVVITDLDGNITYVNQKFVESTGYTRDEVIGKSPRILKSGDTRQEDYEKLWQTILTGKEWKGEFHNRKKSGELFWESAVIRPMKNEKGAITHFLALKEDITERRSLEVQLRHAQKLESIGQLAAGIAHEINTPTQYIGDNVAFLSEAFGDLKDLLASDAQLPAAAHDEALSREIVQKIVDGVQRADIAYLQEEIPKALAQTTDGIRSVSKLVSAMKEFSHPGAKEKTPRDLNQAIQSTITVSRHEWKYFADVETDFDASLPLVSCLPNEFNQVILNLIVNAAHAIDEGIKKKGANSGKGKIRVTTRKHKDWAEIRVQDTGVGIPQPIQNRVFDPFFTTKEVGKGTGQGLAIARSVVVDKHQGSIHFETEEGKGTTFVVRLPFEGKSVPELIS